MSKPIVEVRAISKHYRLGAIGATRLRDDLERFWHRMAGGHSKAEKSEFWALRDVSFEVQPGEVVGIIGRNGAGKSTLLKILSRITEPTAGEIVLRGRVASLLEVGTGFVADLSGRDNIYLNGAILGMAKAEIRAKFDEIVAFAEVDKFIDTPVKRYSSGMYVRLAFAVAAHLDPEILIIDEVLAVGDQDFQRKCLGKLSQAAKSGKTVIFVSHSMAAVSSLCTSGVVMREGRVELRGSTQESVDAYLREATMDHSGRVDTSSHASRGKGMKALIQSVELVANGMQTSTLQSGERVSIVIALHSDVAVKNPRYAFAIEDPMARRVLTGTTYLEGLDVPALVGRRQVTATFDLGHLAPGRYFLSLSVADKYGGLLDSIDSALAFDVDWGRGTGNGEPYQGSFGMQVVRSQWEC